MTVADLIRANATLLGVDLSHIDDHELGVRLAAMPARATETADGAARWLAFGTLDGPRDMVRA